uniref:non-specific serine/threonine protein kinase n=1 Tax=Psilocybe cubensis TaxID=181762 RepID=A0A8H7XUV1_PSICU
MALLLLCAFAALLAWSQALSTRSADSQELARRAAVPSDYTSQRYGLPPVEEATPNINKEYDLLDIVLVASVDGKFHALKRSTGHILWSMSSFATTTSVSAPSSLAPLVRSSHPTPDFEAFDEPQQETYIIEPQSGFIYVLPTPDAPLQRFPFTMAELVELSPFTSGNPNDTRVFVGRKETSLLLIELETGKIKATLNAECPFIPDEFEDTPIDLDELEGSKPPMSAPTEVYIGRTDYIITIHQKPKPGMPLIPAQELSFSTYGPNNKDNHLQAIYHRTNDDMYVQSLTNGEIIAFHATSGHEKGRKAKPTDPESGKALWGHPFKTPIVAIFDVLQPVPATPHHGHSAHPIVLLQPRPRLQDLFPKLSSGPGLADPLLGKLASAYVGLVEETGSLFVMSADRYPLVVFSGGDRPGLSGGENGVESTYGRRTKYRAIDPPNAHTNSDEAHVGVLEDVEAADREYCAENPYDPRCLVGVRGMELGDGVEDRMKRLIDGPKTQAPAEQQPMGGNPQHRPVVQISPLRDVVVEDSENSSGGGSPQGRKLLEIDGPPTGSVSSRYQLVGSIDSNGGQFGRPPFGGAWEAVILSTLFGLLTVWVMWAKVKIRVGLGKQNSSEVVDASPKTTKLEEAVGISKAEGDTKLQVIAAESDPTIQNKDLDSIASRPAAAANVDESPTSVPGGVGTSKKETPTLDLPPIPTPLAPSEGLATPIPGTPTPGSGAPLGAEDGEDNEGEADGGASATPGKRRRPRGQRGKKKKQGLAPAPGSGEWVDIAKDQPSPPKEEEEKKPSIILTSSSPKPPVIQPPSLVVSDTILGFGSHGTVVFQGSLQGRAVAVKRLLQDFVTLAAREVSILQESDDHPNVIRYYYQESQGNFLYIALELCPASLADIIECPDREQWRDIAINFDPKRALKQITSGLRHLHALKLVHRDIKPQNILVSFAKSGAGGGFGGRAGGAGAAYRMLISDFGLCKKLDTDQTSFLPTAHGAMGAGTVGWRAPEILRGEVKLDEMSTGDDASLSSRGSVATINGNSSTSSGGGVPSSNMTRLTKSVDIFALGCLFYYTLTNGGHPYGDRFEREVNIMRDEKDLSGLERYGEEGTEAKNLIEAMLSFEARKRPDTTTCLLHPFFWDPGRRLNFLQDASDRFEIMCRDPKDQHLLTLETGAQSVVGNDWHSRLDKIFIDNLGKYRKYDGRSVQDLLRALRNKDLPDNVKRHLGPMPEGFLGYFTRRYPQLFLHVHGVIQDTGLHSESMFRTYFELPDS